MTDSKKNLALWDAVQKTNPDFTKDFSRGGGFKGTAVNPVYLIKRATELWGPIGDQWDFNVIEESFREGAPFVEMVDNNPTVMAREVIHIIKGQLRYPVDGKPKEGVVNQYGQTTFVGRNKYGYFTDEEAPKKSYTDALTKCLSQLGFSADVHMGMWDDNKYVTEVKKEFNEKKKTEEKEKADAGKTEEQLSAEKYFSGLKKAGWDKIPDWWEAAVEKSGMDAVDYARIGWAAAKSEEAKDFIAKWIKAYKEEPKDEKTEEGPVKETGDGGKADKGS